MSCTTRILMFGNSVIQYKTPTATSEFQSHPRIWLATSTLRQWCNLGADSIKPMPRDFHAFDSRYFMFGTTIWGEADCNEGKPQFTETNTSKWKDIRILIRGYITKGHTNFFITWLLSICERHAILHITWDATPEPFRTYPQEHARSTVFLCVLN